MKRTTATMIGIGLLLLLGCATRAPTEATLATTVEDVVGIWHRTERHAFAGGEIYIQFKEDGTAAFAMRADRIEDHPMLEGEVWFEGTQFHWKDIAAVEKWEVCLVPYPTAIYQVQLLENGNLKFIQVKDECWLRPSILLSGGTKWEPVR